MSRLTVVGAGYVGLVTAACMAELGHEIIAMDGQHGLHYINGIPL